MSGKDIPPAYSYHNAPPGYFKTTVFLRSPKLHDPPCKRDSYWHAPPVGLYTVNNNLLKPDVSPTRKETLARRTRVTDPMNGSSEALNMSGGHKLHYPNIVGVGDYNIGDAVFRRAGAPCAPFKSERCTNQFRSRSPLFFQNKAMWLEEPAHRRESRCKSTPSMPVRITTRENLLKEWSRPSPPRVRTTAVQNSRDEEVAAVWQAEYNRNSPTFKTRAYGGKYTVAPLRPFNSTPPPSWAPAPTPPSDVEMVQELG